VALPLIRASAEALAARGLTMKNITLAIKNVTLAVGLVALAPFAIASDDTVPPNPFLFQNSTQPIIHFNSAQTDTTPTAMPLGKITIDPKNVRYLPASLAIPGSVHKNYDDGTGAILRITSPAGAPASTRSRTRNPEASARNSGS
jgi:hypothetical protein